MKRPRALAPLMLAGLTAAGPAVAGPAAAGSPAVVPFDLFANHVLVPVEIDGRGPFRLILDTGMPYDGVVLFAGSRVDSLLGTGAAGAPASCAVADANADACGGGGGQTTNALLDLSGVAIEDQTVTVVPSPWPAADAPYAVAEGIIGRSVFGRYVVRIDYDRKVVTLFDPGEFHGAEGGETRAIPRDEFGIPQVECEITLADGRSIAARLVLDTGASHALSLRVGSDEAIVVPEGAVAGRLGRTMYGEVTGHFGRVSSLRLGRLQLDDVVTSFSSGAPVFAPEEKKHGNLGNGSLRRFLVTIDYSTDTLILEPGGTYSEPFEHDMAGAQFARTPGGRLEIERVAPASPAAESGLVSGDVVVSIDGRACEALDHDEVRALLRREGRVAALRVEREGEELAVDLRLRRLI